MTEPADVAQPDVPAAPSAAPEPSQEPQASTPPEATSPEPGPVPYERFKEVNEQLKGLKESQDWLGYQRLKEALDRDPNFSKYFLDTVQGYFTKPQQPQPQPQDDPYKDYPAELAEPLRKTQMLEQTVQQLVGLTQAQQQQAVYQQYAAQLDQKVATAKVPDHWKGYYRQEVERMAASANPYALSQYDPALIERVFEQVDQTAKAIQRAERGNYVVEKKQDITPASTSSTGAPAQKVQSVQTAEDRASLAAELLRAARS